MNGDPLSTRVASFVHRHRLLGDGEGVVVAVSGGSDSLALLHLLRTIALDLRLTAAYIDHGLRPAESPQEQRVIGNHCASLGVPLVTAAVNVPQLLAREKRSPEEAARLLRYQALEELRRQYGATVIAIGHTADDQVEEFFLRLLRGSGRKGFCGMAPRSGRLVRPLLEERKATLIRHLEAHELSWCFDSSNAQHHFLRNRVRLELLPYLERDFSPGLRDTVLRAMDIFTAEEDLLESLCDAAWEDCLTEARSTAGTSPPLALDIASCRRQHPAMLRRLLEKCFWKMGVRPSFRQIALVREFIDRGKSGGMLHLEGGLRAERLEGRLRLSRLHTPAKGRVPTTTPVLDLAIPGPGCYPLPAIDRELHLRMISRSEETPGGGLMLDAAHITFPLQLRSVRPGERFLPCHGKGSKKVNRFLGERKIPAGERFAWPVLTDGEHILALPGLEISHRYRLTAQTTTVLELEWRRPARAEY